jgi:hypothetical protein
MGNEEKAVQTLIAKDAIRELVLLCRAGSSHAAGVPNRRRRSTC